MTIDENQKLLDEQREDYFQLKRDLLKELSTLRLENEILRERNALLEGFKQGVEEYKEAIERRAFEAACALCSQINCGVEWYCPSFDDWQRERGK